MKKRIMKAGSIAPVNFLLTVLVLGIVIYLIYSMIEKRNEEKRNEK